MVSWDCHNCGGSGRSNVTIIRDGRITQVEERCTKCYGAGSLRNGKPEIYIEVYQNEGERWY